MGKIQEEVKISKLWVAWGIFSLIALSVVLVINYRELLQEYNERQVVEIELIKLRDNIKQLERFEMCNLNLTEDQFLNGVYFKDRYFCVWTAGRNGTEIKNTFYHETLHSLIAEDYYHFCVNSSTPTVK